MEEKGIKNNFRVSALGNKVICEIIENNGNIEKKCPWRGKKRQLKLLDFIWQQGDPRWGGPQIIQTESGAR